MNGSSARNLQNWTIEDVKTPEGYLDYLFHGMQGYVYRATIDPVFKQSPHRASQIGSMLFECIPDCYISMNTFWRSRDLRRDRGRDTGHLKRLLTLFVDVDCYKKHISKAEAYKQLQKIVADGLIPEPTIVCDSGRGLSVIWKLRNEDCRAHSRWRAVQEYLVHTLEEIGADANCVDAARVLRVPGTINSKSGTAVSVLAFNDRTYSIYEISKAYHIKPTNKLKGKMRKGKYPYGHATEKQRNFVRDLAAHLDITEADYPDFADFRATDAWIKAHWQPKCVKETKCRRTKHGLLTPASRHSFLAGNYSDIRALLLMRKGVGCMRETGLFLYRYFLLETGVCKEQALRMTLELNAALDCPLDKSEVIQATASAERRIQQGIPYAYKRSTIIKVLQITPEELTHLPHLSSRVQPSQEYRKAANRRAYEKRLADKGRHLKCDAVLQRRTEILKLQEQGKTAREIQACLRISKATYYRDIAALGTKRTSNAAKAFLRERSGQLKAVQRSQKTSYAALIWRAHQRKIARPTKSHFFSTPFRKRTENSVLPAIHFFRSKRGGFLRCILFALRAGDRSSGDEPDGIHALIKYAQDASGDL
ncbi:MAG: hypothetical protein ACI4P4_09345 [Faecousia sp.]